MDRQTKPSILATKYLMYFCSAVWLLLAIVLAAGLHPAIPEGALYRWGMAILSALASIILLLAYHRMVKQGGLAYYLILVMLSTISVLTVTDEFGLVDLLVLSVHLVALTLILKDRHDYLRTA